MLMITIQFIDNLKEGPSEPQKWGPEVNVNPESTTGLRMPAASWMLFEEQKCHKRFFYTLSQTNS